MKLIIAGGRDYQFNRRDIALLNDIHKKYTITEVVSGAAPGADMHGEMWAATNGIPVKQFPADWDKHGRAAGPIRNRQMADYAEALAIFPGGRGTRSMREIAEQHPGITMIFDGAEL